MEKKEVLIKIFQKKIIAILRMDDPYKVLPTAQAIKKGGISAIEVSLNTPNALECIKELSQLEGLIIGAGTVTNEDMVYKTVAAGAQYVISPICSKEIIDAAHDLDRPVIAGGYTPTEIYQAMEWGADMVKVFPAFSLGMSYITALKAPFPDIKLMPTGGVTADNIDQWFDAGADCVGVGACFTNKAILKNKYWSRQTTTARELVMNIGHYLETHME